MLTLIKNGMIYDGTLNDPFIGDILIKDERIEKISEKIDGVDADIVIDAEGKTVTPGFIDQHRHADLALFRDDFGSIELAQGLTTIGTGVCGFSFAPYTEKSEGLYDYTDSLMGPSVDGARYTSMADYLQACRKANIPINIGTLQGLGAVRLAVKGYDPSPYTKDEMEKAQDYVKQAIDLGLRGFSAGLVYNPEMYTTTEEVIEMLKPCRGKDLLYMPHMRDEASRLPEAVEESIRIARESDMALGISHFKALGPDNWHTTLEKAIEKIEKARSEGMDITVDFYPYHGTATTLASILPLSYLTEPFGDIMKKITTEKEIERMRYCYLNPGPKDELIPPDFRWAHTLISGVTLEENKKYLGKPVIECMQMSEYDDVYTFIAHLLESENGSVAMVGLNIDKDDIKRIFKLPYASVISDSLYGITDTPHPRAYASFTHVIKHYVLEEHAVSMQEAVHKMTQTQAERMRYKDRGVLRNGAYADVLIFEPEKLGDNAVFDDSKKLSTGMEYVFVNGKIAWKDEKLIEKNGLYLN